jgi:hypothetical protein
MDLSDFTAAVCFRWILPEKRASRRLGSGPSGHQPFEAAFASEAILARAASRRRQRPAFNRSIMLRLRRPSRRRARWAARPRFTRRLRPWMSRVPQRSRSMARSSSIRAVSAKFRKWDAATQAKTTRQRWVIISTTNPRRGLDVGLRWAAEH